MEPYISNCGIGLKKGERRLIDDPSAQHVSPIVRDVVTSSMAGTDRQLDEARSWCWHNSWYVSSPDPSFGREGLACETRVPCFLGYQIAPVTPGNGVAEFSCRPSSNSAP